MKIKTKAELELLSNDELKAYNKELAEYKERAKLLKELGELEEESTVTEVNATPERKIGQIAEAKKNGNESPELIQELVAIKAELEQARKEKTSTFGKVHFEKSVEKVFGTNGAEVISMAKDVASSLPIFDMVAKMAGKKVTELSAWKDHFGIEEGDLKNVLIAIQKQNTLMARSRVLKTALDTSDSSEWIPVGFEASVMDAILKAKGVAQNIPSFDMPSASFDWPVNAANGTTYFVTESLTGGEITVSGSNISAGKTTFSAKKIANRQDFSEEMNEDTAFALLPAIQRMMADGLNDGFERVVLFGDTQGTTTNINYNGASVTTTAGAADVFTATTGLIYKALVSSNGSKKDVNAAASPSEAVRLTMAQMGEGAKDAQNLRLFVPPAFYFAMLDDPSIKNLQNYGAGASILSGEVARCYGIPVIMTSGIPLTGSDGKIDGATSGNNVLASFVVVNNSRVMVGFKRRVKLASNFFAITDNNRLVASMRFDVQQFGANVANRNPIGYGYNYPV